MRRARENLPNISEEIMTVGKNIPTIEAEEASEIDAKTRNKKKSCDQEMCSSHRIAFFEEMLHVEQRVERECHTYRSWAEEE